MESESRRFRAVKELIGFTQQLLKTIDVLVDVLVDVLSQGKSRN